MAKAPRISFTLLNVFNMMTANRPIWENKDPTRIEFPDGTSMQAMKHAMEPYHWISDPDKTLSNFYKDICNYGHPNFNAHLPIGFLENPGIWKDRIISLSDILGATTPD